MTSSTDPGNKSPEQIERELEEERARLSRTADALQDRLSVGSLIDEVMTRTQTHGGDFAKNFGRTVRDNPVPVALIGVGLAWLMAGGQGATDRRDGALGRFRGSSDWDDEGGYASMTGYRSRHLPHDEAGGGIPRSGVDWDDDDSPGMGKRLSDSARSARDSVTGAAGSAAGGVGSAASSAGDALSGAASRAGGAARSAGGAVSDAASRTGQAASDAAGYVGERARAAGQSMSRAQAEAYWRARRYGSRASDGLDRMIEEQPLVVGALALALGAAIGGLAPNTRAENRLMGEHAERLRGQAAGAAAEEARKARRVAEAAADEAGRMADEAAGEADKETPDGRSIVEKAEARLREGAERLADRASEEAERQDLGSSVERKWD